jgi:glutamine---fructose-6-phosphate transaminase (isomerizing)
VTLSPFELDIAAQPDALRRFADAAARPGLTAAAHRQYDRIVFTGMGSSHFAALPSWRRLVADGYRAWWVDTGQLLDSARLITPDTLLVITSQSGASGEIAALLGPGQHGPGEHSPGEHSPVRPRAVVGITNEAGSPLAGYAEAVIALRCGPEATVSTKSYINSLAAHQQLLHVLTGAAFTAAALTEVAKLMEDLSDPAGRAADAVAQVVTTASNPRIAYIGSKDHAATALYAGLITKEAAKVAAEGFIGGQFRHGPLELAGPGLAAVLFGAWAGDASTPLPGLAADLIASGADVTLVGDLVSPGARTIVIPRGPTLTELATGAVVAQHIAVRIARARGLEPGRFAYGRKVTTTL